MQKQDFTLSVHYIRQIADQMDSMGADVQSWLNQSHLSDKQLSDPLQTVSYPVFHQLILNALAMTDEPAFGLLVGERLLAGTHGILGYAAMNSGTIREAVELFEQYIRVRTTLVSISHEVRGKEVCIVFHDSHPLGSIRRPVLEAVVLTVKNVFDFITLGACHVGWVSFPFDRPVYAALAHDLFKCDVRYGQSWAGFTLPLDVIDLPLKMADPATFQDAALICQRELDKQTKKESFSLRVRRIMLEKKNGFPSLNVTARLFHLAPRTLHRRLLEEGTSFKEILEEVRHMLAVEHLKSDHLTIQEIGYTLGYTDMANFRRAFKRWEGVSPSHYRASFLRASMVSFDATA